MSWQPLGRIEPVQPEWYTDFRMSPAVSPRVSIIVVAWNSAAHLSHCLEALTAQSCRDFEVILVDNDSSDGGTFGVEHAYASLQLRIERLSFNRGFAAAVNLAASLARGDWLIMLNPDAFPEPDWLGQLMQAADSSSDSYFASRQIQAKRPRLLDGEGDSYHVSGLAQRRNYNFPVFRGGQPYEVFSACAVAALVSRSDFLESGGLDEDYFAYQEDVDLGFRLRLRGLRCMYVPAAVVHHVGAAGAGRRSAASTYFGHRNLVWTYIKDMPAPWVWVYLPLHLALNVGSLIYFTVIGQGGAIWRAKFDAVRGIPAALRKRRLIQAQRQVHSANILGAMSRNLFAPLAGWIVRHYPPLDSR